MRTAGALIAGFLTVLILSLATDQLLHVLNVYPPWGQPMFDPWLNLLALSYRCVYGALGSYIAARLAPHAPMRHAMILGFIGLPFAIIGAVVSITRYDLGPAWYPIALVITTLPCAWLGGLLYTSSVIPSRADGEESPEAKDTP